MHINKTAGLIALYLAAQASARPKPPMGQPGPQPPQASQASHGPGQKPSGPQQPEAPEAPKPPVDPFTRFIHSAEHTAEETTSSAESGVEDGFNSAVDGVEDGASSTFNSVKHGLGFRKRGAPQPPSGSPHPPSVSRGPQPPQPPQTSGGPQPPQSPQPPQGPTPPDLPDAPEDPLTKLIHEAEKYGKKAASSVGLKKRGPPQPPQASGGPQPPQASGGPQTPQAPQGPDAPDLPDAPEDPLTKLWHEIEAAAKKGAGSVGIGKRGPPQPPQASGGPEQPQSTQGAGAPQAPEGPDAPEAPEDPLTKLWHEVEGAAKKGGDEVKNSLGFKKREQLTKPSFIVECIRAPCPDGVPHRLPTGPGPAKIPKSAQRDGIRVELQGNNDRPAWEDLIQPRQLH